MTAAPTIQAVERMQVAPESGAAFERAVVRLFIPAELVYFAGHFQGCPLLPGVVQLKWAIELGRAHLPIAGEFCGVSALKFMRVIQPAQAIELELEVRPAGRLRFEYRRDGDVCASGVALFQA